MIRWNKVWRDLWLDKPRTILVILSITIGVIGVGVVGQAKYFLAKGMENSFSSSNPANVTIMGESFDKNVMSQIEKLANVKMVQAENTIYGKMRLLKDQDDVSDHQQWKSLKLLSVSDFKKIKLNKLYLEQGNWPSDNQDVVLERTAMDFVGAQIGDEIIIQTPNGKEEKFHITGTVLDPIRETSHISGYAYAYTTLETIINRKLANSVNTALIQVSPSVNNKKLLDDLAIKARDILNSNHISVFTIDLVEPNKHWANDIVKSTGTILEIYGLLGLLLGTGLIFN
ncbi:MAG TPA: ABC transporter permease, partial [Pseudoneobacillus sp.]|nr:ABC transporter permease [Pseudoneobacillus sp.]